MLAWIQGQLQCMHFLGRAAQRGSAQRLQCSWVCTSAAVLMGVHKGRRAHGSTRMRQGSWMCTKAAVLMGQHECGRACGCAQRPPSSWVNMNAAGLVGVHKGRSAHGSTQMRQGSWVCTKAAVLMGQHECCWAGGCTLRPQYSWVNTIAAVLMGVHRGRRAHGSTKSDLPCILCVRQGVMSRVLLGGPPALMVVRASACARTHACMHGSTHAAAAAAAAVTAGRWKTLSAVSCTAGGRCFGMRIGCTLCGGPKWWTTSQTRCAGCVALPQNSRVQIVRVCVCAHVCVYVGAPFCACRCCMCVHVRMHAVGSAVSLQTLTMHHINSTLF